MSGAGPKPDLTWLPIKKLVFDDHYQRGVGGSGSRRLIRRIAGDFRWARFQAILAVPNGNGTWTVIDGQHRIEAARRRGGISEVPAVVIEAADLAETAHNFVAINRDRVAINAIQVHHALLAAGDKNAEAIETLCRRAGVTIPRYMVQASQMKPGQTLAVGTIGHCLDEFGPQATEAALSALSAAYQHRPGLIRAAYIKALAWLFAGKYGDPPDQDTVAATLATRRQEDLNLEAGAFGEVNCVGKAIALAGIIKHLIEMDAKHQPQKGEKWEPGVPKGAPTTLKAAVSFLLGQGFRVGPGAKAGTHRFGDCQGFTATEVIAFADQMRFHKKRAV